MQITIEYESSWRNSFLDGSNNEALPKQGRKFIGSMTSLKLAENFLHRDITLDTVMGILNRLIGDQRKLYQSRNQSPYYFADIEPMICFTDKKEASNNEIVYLRNMMGSYDQNAFTGAIKTDDVIFSSDYATEFWGVLALDFEEVCRFITDDVLVTKTIQADPLSIIARLEMLNVEKAVECLGLVDEAKQVLNRHFPDADYLNNKGLVSPIMFYCSALYLQLTRLSERFDMATVKTKSGGISGISKRGFTKKDFMDRFTTGGKKRIWGNPYIRKERIKGQGGEVVSMLTKANGQLEIILDINNEKAKEIQQLIENAGVSSFYLGKKGLAYVTKIRL
jgi:hypothetical protein